MFAFIILSIWFIGFMIVKLTEKPQPKIVIPKEGKFEPDLNLHGLPCQRKRQIYPTARKHAAVMRNIQNRTWNYEYAMNFQEREIHRKMLNQSDNSVNPRTVIDGIITGITLSK